MKKFLIICLFISSSVFANPYEWKVNRVVDGDTVSFQTPFSIPELGKNISVRIISIDTPEKNQLAKCEKEKQLGIRASEYTKTLFAGHKVALVNVIGWDKYGGRIDGDIIVNGKNVAQELISNGLARPYDGGKKSDWCK